VSGEDEQALRASSKGLAARTPGEFFPIRFLTVPLELRLARGAGI
jgi:hypothetical protein